MRRLYSLLLLLSAFGAFVGCRHVAGICDCQPDSFCGCHRSQPVGAPLGPVTSTADANAPGVPAAPVELPRAMPSGANGTNGSNLAEPKVLPVPPTNNAPKFN